MGAAQDLGSRLDQRYWDQALTSQDSKSRIAIEIGCGSETETSHLCLMGFASRVTPGNRNLGFCGWLK